MTSVWEKEEWTRNIFNTKKVHKYNVEAVFLQLIAARLTETTTISDVPVWRLTREDELDHMSEYR